MGHTVCGSTADPYIRCIVSQTFHSTEMANGFSRRLVRCTQIYIKLHKNGKNLNTISKEETALIRTHEPIQTDWRNEMKIIRNLSANTETQQHNCWNAWWNETQSLNYVPNEFIPNLKWIAIIFHWVTGFVCAQRMNVRLRICNLINRAHIELATIAIPSNR